MADKVITSTGDCSACCDPAPTGCECALLIPPFASPYADYATAETAIADQTSSCIGYVVYTPSGDPDNVFTAAFDGTTLELDGTTEGNLALPGTRNLDTYASISTLSGGVVSVAYAITTDGSDYETTIELLDCTDGTALDSDTATTSTGTLTVTAPADGEYVLHIQNRAGVGTIDANYVTATNDVTCDLDYWVNPVIALWDDGGTTRRLWACPKLLLPPLTEDTGTWYADATAAADAITDLTSNCDGYIESLTNVASFTATDGGTSLTLANTLTAGATTSPRMWGGLNVEDTETLTVTATVGAGTASVNVNIYDDTGTLVEASGTTSSPWTSAAVGYTGRYTVSVAVTSSSNTTSMSAAITSSGTISVNPVQARYDLGLACAATDDC